MTKSDRMHRNIALAWAPAACAVVVWVILWAITNRDGYSGLGFLVDLVMITVVAMLVIRARSRHAAQRGDASDGPPDRR